MNTGDFLEEELSVDEVFLKRLITTINDNLGNPDFGIAELGKEVGVSRSHIHRKLHTLTGKSPSRFIRSIRLHKAKELLEKNIGNVSEVADRTGFRSLSYFSQVFFEEFGYLPKDVRLHPADIHENHQGPLGLRNLIIADRRHKEAPSRLYKYIIPLRRSLQIILAVLVLAVVAWYVYPGNQRSNRIDVHDKSIAIVPFDNLSNDDSQRFFAYGVMVDIFNSLQRRKDLKVVSGNSMEKYETTALSVTEIAKELRVRYILEGSVRKSNTKIIITAQLIDAIEDRHLWGDTFTADYIPEKIYEIQNTIARQISSNLQLSIEPDDVLRKALVITNSIKAYEAFQLGRYVWKANRADNEKAIRYFQRAIELDPDYSIAYGYLARSFAFRQALTVPGNWGDSAIAYAEKGLEKDPNCEQCLLTESYYKGRTEKFQYLNRILLINPNNLEALTEAALMCDTDDPNSLNMKCSFIERIIKIQPEKAYFVLGELFSGVGNGKRSLEYYSLGNDGRDRHLLRSVAHMNIQLGYPNEARKLYQQLYSITGDSMHLYHSRILPAFSLGNYETVVKNFEEYPNYYYKNVVAFSYSKLGQQNIADSLANLWIKDGVWTESGYAAIDMNLALDKLEEVGGAGGLFYPIFFRELNDNPRYKALEIKSKEMRKRKMEIVSKYNFPLPKDL